MQTAARNESDRSACEFAGVTVAVVSKSDQSPLPIFNVASSLGQFICFGNGTNTFQISDALPGQKFKVSAEGFMAAEHVLQMSEIARRFAQVALVRVKPSASPTPDCPFETALQSAKAAGGTAGPVLDLYRRVKVAMDATRSRDAIDECYSALAGPSATAIASDPALALDFLTFLVEITPIVATFAPRDEFAFCSRPSRGPVLTHALSERALEVIRRFHQRAKLAHHAQIEHFATLIRRSVGKTAGEIIAVLDEQDNAGFIEPDHRHPLSKDSRRRRRH